MEQVQHPTHLTYADYQLLEEETQQKYEYHGGTDGYGEVFAMAGAEPKHNAICVNAISALNQLLRDRACNVLNSDQKVRIEAVSKSLYPDVSVVCGELERFKDEKRAITNPVLLIEVLSDSTANYDRGSKFRYYSQLSSLKEYVLIEQHAPVVQIYYRTTINELWKTQWVEGLDATVKLQSLGLELPMKELYLKTENL